jgi:hypothetical protein
MNVPVHCPSCHHRAVWWTNDGLIEVVEVIQVGGSRQPTTHPTLAAWRTWRASRVGELGPVVGACPACAQPLIADGPGLPAAPPWTLESAAGPFTVSAAALLGPSGQPVADAFVEATLDRELRARFTDQLDSSLIFAGFLLMIFGAVALFWIGAALFVVNFYLAMAGQGDFTGPFVK